MTCRQISYLRVVEHGSTLMLSALLTQILSLTSLLFSQYFWWTGNDGFLLQPDGGFRQPGGVVILRQPNGASTQTCANTPAAFRCVSICASLCLLFIELARQQFSLGKFES